MPVPPVTQENSLLTRYADYLASECGLSAKTVARHVTALRPFLAALDPGGLAGPTARQVTTSP